MKIAALRVRNVGRFATPVALEGLSGRLDILVGRNETGKSTLFSALHALFTLNTRRPTNGSICSGPISAGSRMSRLISTSAAGDCGWQSSSAVEGPRSLVDCATGRAIANGADVDAKLHALCGSHLGALGLVWVRQTASLEKLQPSADETGVLTSAIARGGVIRCWRAARTLRAGAGQQGARRAVDRTNGRQPSRAGRCTLPWFAGSHCAASLETAHRRASDVANATVRLGDLRQRFAELTNPVTIAELEHAWAQAASRVVDGERAHDRLVSRCVRGRSKAARF